MFWLSPASALASTTPTEAAAIAAARNDHTAYTLPPDKLAKSAELDRFYDTLYFVRAGWGMLALFLILQLGIAAGMRDFAVRILDNPWSQGPIFMLLLLL